MKPIPHLLAGDLLRTRLEWEFWRGQVYGVLLGTLAATIAFLWLEATCA